MGRAKCHRIGTIGAMATWLLSFLLKKGLAGFDLVVSVQGGKLYVSDPSLGHAWSYPETPENEETPGQGHPGSSRPEGVKPA